MNANSIVRSADAAESPLRYELSFGPVPRGEHSAAALPDPNQEVHLIQVETHYRMLKRIFRDAARHGCYITTVGKPGNIDGYREVVIQCHRRNLEAVSYCDSALRRQPARWDDRAMFETIWHARRMGYMEMIHRGDMPRADLPEKFNRRFPPEPPEGQALREMLIQMIGFAPRVQDAQSAAQVGA